MLAVVTEPERGARLRALAIQFDTQPGLLAAARRLRRRLPGDEKFGDPLSTAGVRPVEVVARGVSALGPERESVLQEVGLAGLQLWQSLSEAAGRGRGDQSLALLFTDLVGFSSWALKAGDVAALELLREVGTAVEAAILDRDGRIVKRLGDGQGALADVASGVPRAAAGGGRGARRSGCARGHRDQRLPPANARWHPLGTASPARR